MWELPTTVNVIDRVYKIRNNGDYRIVLKIFNARNSEELNETERAIAMLCLFYDSLDDADDVFKEFETVEYLQEATKQMSVFIACGDMENEQGLRAPYPLIDWKNDEKIIAAGINSQLGAGKDIRMIDYMHWWTFQSYFLGIREGILATVVGIRDKIIRGKKLEKWEQEFRRDNPGYFTWRQNLRTPEEKQLEQEILARWNDK